MEFSKQQHLVISLVANVVYQMQLSVWLPTRNYILV